jgi:hypothetical protein
MDFISRCKRNRNTVIIPDGVNFIPDRAFFKDKNLTIAQNIAQPIVFALVLYPQ